MTRISGIHWTGATAVAVLMGLLPAGTQAAQAGSVTATLQLAGEVRSASAVQKVAAGRQCRRVDGVRHCRPAAERPDARKSGPGDGYGYSYGAPKAEFYPAGSKAWWEAMEREGRTGNGPD